MFLDIQYDPASKVYKQGNGRPDIPVITTAWKENQPNDKENKHCIVMKTGDDFRLDDKYCTEKKGGVCFTPFAPGFIFP